MDFSGGGAGAYVKKRGLEKKTLAFMTLSLVDINSIVFWWCARIFDQRSWGTEDYCIHSCFSRATLQQGAEAGNIEC
jgi:hypothetical protein